MNEYYRTCKFAKPEPKRHERPKVSNDTYQKVFKACEGKCVLMDGTCNGGLELHHIQGRGKNLTDNPLNCVMLCSYHHRAVVHGNLKKYRPILINLAKEIYKNGSI